jgi:putative solute:sodium symporter small subunit
MSDFNTQSYWLRTKALTVTTLAFWMAFSLGAPMWAVLLNEISVPYLDIPLGFFMTTQGALVSFLLILHLFARRQDRIDRDHFSDGR